MFHLTYLPWRWGWVRVGKGCWYQLAPFLFKIFVIPSADCYHCVLHYVPLLERYFNGLLVVEQLICCKDFFSNLAERTLYQRRATLFQRLTPRCINVVQR